MRVEFHADDAIRTHNGTEALKDVAFHIVVAVGDHRAVQSEQHAIQRQCRFELRQHLIAHEFIVGAVGGAGRTSGKAASFDQREAFRRATNSGAVHMRGASVGCSPGRRNTLSL